MVLLGLGLLIASVSFLCYKHSPATWWGFLGRLQPVTGIRDAGKREDVGSGNIGGDEEIKKDGGGSGGNTKVKKSTDGPSLKMTESLQDAPIIGNKTMPPPSKAALDRAAMPPPPPPLFKKPAPPNKIPSSPTTPRANASQPSPNTNIPIFSLDGSNPSSPEPDIPSFPAANSAQRASGGTRAIPRLNALPTTPSLIAPSRGPIPNRSPLPNRTPTSSLTAPSLAPPPTHNSIPTKPRKKVLLTPNHSPLDWARLTTSPNSNLRGLPPSTPYLRVPPSLLKQYTGRKSKDAWTVLGGKVYNLTPYLPYHPGGEPELMKCAGRDGTRLFGEVHPWVNWEGMLEACLVGISVAEEEVEGHGGLEDMD
ncbi:hypothetical protein SS1G_02655 [Sclerotinia sclerotiorum 1980 UF-70]|uniref:Cytochrome b5 heme-binding domain-containing protein n=2 Tax=Sclerotinia sclerotiorum (strain ATCC 18683 / 1980 / Ss-1) TaxID=665079 RepID=A7EBG9_SCLS1|nr:hypothetical protein SS1G_02655 [Sclerotinia sclerotiorum 1980 UF-70]APA08852.1 hypothetical protein sscle_04g036220 [Sclerotinia sclerotiorum 1980 UF-70]EDN99797.1 hypothetical protein SS1G_02655 [Sclerotinia sclerotiorum 1980 UF-70]